MNEIIHDLMKSNKNHIGYGLSYPNQTAMEQGVNEIDGQVLAVRHLGKTARVLDTNRTFMLIAFDPVIIWQPEDAAGPLLEAVTMHLDASTGNDLTGDGSSGAPYKTFTRAFQTLENKNISHVVKMKPAAGVYDEFPEESELPMTVNGQVVIDASGETYPVIVAGLAIGTIADVGPQDIFGTALATELTPNAAPSWTVDQHIGKFAHFKTGAYANRVLPIWRNTATSIITDADYFGFQIGDTFDIVDAPVKIQVDHPIKIRGITIGENLTEFRFPELCMAGIEIECTTGDSSKSPLFLRGVSCVFNFCKLVDMWNADNFSIPLLLRDAKINLDFVPANTFDNTELEEWLNYNFNIFSNAGAPPTAGGIDIATTESSIATGMNKVFCRRKIAALAPSVPIFYTFCGGITTIGFAGVFAGTTGNLFTDHVFVEQLNYDETAFYFSNFHVYFSATYIHKSGQPIELYDNGYVFAEWLHGGTINATHALKIGRASHLYIDVETDVTLLGTAGAINWVFDNTNVAAWPTAGNFANKVDSYVSTKT
jgi:hypothetical protein